MQVFVLYQRNAGFYAHLSVLLLPLLPWLLVWQWHAEPWLGFALVWLGFGVGLAALLIGILMLGDSVRWGLSGGYISLRLTPQPQIYSVLAELLHVLLPPLLTTLSLGAVWLYVHHLRGATPPTLGPEMVLLGLLGLSGTFLAMRLVFVKVRVQARTVLSMGLTVACSLVFALGGLASVLPPTSFLYLGLLTCMFVLLVGLNVAHSRRP
ncbi:hypothetical protein [Deinococcus cellulosilyticus]|uniref:Uncharacterized protein n=1 Tax=Deinococcus cellulosilyticus (strain DSM 18568 / NBRC 106333 / KACC 11606 / 5516J-15) TaxID=1223518 RepID=A0A511N968_DEIC1|nr:hypothetical protein [Deinococcus cellulosilyticus]GEM49372.1 hypothetical protein DC3_50070 [Deinococcus cellulosilyticus NBRC 106333 = KACC 11606]